MAARGGLGALCLALLAPWTPAAADAEHEALLLDDECLSGEDGACGLNAAQLRGQKLSAMDVSGLEDARRALADQKLRQAAELEAQVERLRQEAMTLHWQSHGQKAARARERTRAELRQSEAMPGGLGGTPPKKATFDPRDSKAGKVNPYYNGGLVDGLPGDDQVAIMAARDLDWHIGSVVYQVFVDRFVPPKDLESKREFIKPPRQLFNWTTLPTDGVQNVETKYYTNELAFWGGDLQGVLSKLDYVIELGDILYLQPIFDAFSAHKYDTTDYFKISPEYGTLEDFHELAGAVHKRGMHLVLDGVFNHMGIRSPWFKEAMANPNSEYRNWYFIGPEYGELGYKNWQGGGTLAELRLEDKNLQKTLWNNSDSVVGYWLHEGADGWRLDVGTEIGREFLWDLTQAAHRHKYASMVVGEVSAYPRWWTESLDGILSFWMGWIISGVVTGKMGGVFAGMQIADLIYQTSMEQLLRSWIILSNHDTPRLTTVFPDPVKRKFAVTLQFTLPGTVCIYYGEEISMFGAGDPHNRAPMDWEKVEQDKDMLPFMKHLVQLRRSHRALRIGDYHMLMSFSLLAFIRRTDRIDEIVIVLANPISSPVEERISLPVEDILEYTLFRDLLSNETVRIRGATIQISVPPHTTRILTMVHENGPTAHQYKRIFGHWDSFSSVEPSFSLGNSLSALVMDPHVMANVSTDDGNKEVAHKNPYINPYAKWVNPYAKQNATPAAAGEQRPEAAAEHGGEAAESAEAEPAI